MENEISSLADLEAKLQILENDTDKIELLEKFLRSHTNIQLDLLATIYETLGNLHQKIGNSKGSFYQKAASNWEMLSITSDDSQTKRIAIKKAARNYKIALSLYKSRGYLSGIEETRNKLKEVRSELKNYGGPARTITIGIVMISFIMSFLLLSPQLTGFVAQADAGGTSKIGFLLVVLGIIGVIFILKKWH